MKKLYFALFFVLILAVYLNRAYAHIYATIQSGGFENPKLELEHRVGPVSKNPIKLVILGDSLAAGVGVASAGDTCCHQVANKILATASTSVIIWNYGNPGATSRNVIDFQLNDAIQVKPDLVLILVGVNDLHNFVSPNQYYRNISYIVKSFNANTKILIASVPFLGDNYLLLPPLNVYFDVGARIYSDEVQKVAEETGARMVPLYSLTTKPNWRTNTYYSKDHFHPNSAGYGEWANLFYQEYIKL